MIEPELITLLGGSLLGMAGKFIALQSKRRSEEFKLLASKSETQAKIYGAAIERVPVDAGKWVRRGIVSAVLFGVVLAPFILPFFEIDTVIMTEERRGFFGRLFNSEMKVSYETVKGYLLIPEIRQTLSALVGMYFGTAIMKDK